MTPKSARFEMRFDESALDRIDKWRAGQPDVPSRAEAVRRLIDQSLAVETPTRLQISDGEKLIIYMLADLHQGRGQAIDPELVTQAIGSGHLWALERQYGSLLPREDTDPAVVKDVYNILEMWVHVESAYDRLTKKDKARVLEATGRSTVSFAGFDGNQEPHFHVASFMIDELGLFEVFKGRDINSHHPVVDDYREMYGWFRPMRRILAGRHLSADELIDLLQVPNFPTLKRPK